MKITVFILAVVPAFACTPVAGDHILGKDLAAANPIFAGIAPDLDLGFAPLAGIERTFRGGELARIARDQGIAGVGTLARVCFVRVSEKLTPESLQPVLKASLAHPDTQFQIVDYSRYSVPRGKIEFASSGPDASGLWRGKVIYGEGRSAPLWVKLRMISGAPSVDPSDAPASSETGDNAALEAASSKAPDSHAHDGEAQSPAFESVRPAGPDVRRGDPVLVAVMSGSAYLSFESKAESSGHAGEWVLVKNPDSGRLFRAKVEAKGRVTVEK